MAGIFDFHTHAFPERIPLGPIHPLRKWARAWMKPVSRSFHASQTFLRILPEVVRKPVEQVTSLAPVANLLVESTPEDLLETMSAAGVEQALLIAQPPFLSNEDLLQLCTDHPNLLPAINIPVSTERPGKVLGDFASRGARVLKIHAAADGEGPESPHYKALLKSAADLGLPVVLHTGCIHSNVLFKDPEMGRVERFEDWFKNYPSIPFILAHMNYHEPAIALELASRYPLVYVDTSWQPAEVIGEAVRQLGAEKVLFGSDWPIMGNNIEIGIQRIRDCVETGTVSEQDAEKILGKNARCLLNLPN